MTFPLLNVVPEATEFVDDYEESEASIWGGLLNIGLGADDTPTSTAAPSATLDDAPSDWSDSWDVALSDTEVTLDALQIHHFSLNDLD